MARYAVLRIAKVKTMGHVAGLGLHVERERETRNADEARRVQNERLAGTGDWSADIARRRADAPHERGAGHRARHDGLAEVLRCRR